MATVPLTPSEGLEIGSAPQFSSGRIEPIQDTVTDDLQNFAKAQQNVSAIAFKLQDEFNDAESKKLYNEFYNELEASTNNYLTTKGFDAVKTVNKEEGKSAFDVVNNNNNDLLAKYAELASNGESKYLFENMASVSLNSATNKMTQHSIKQQRLAHENEVKASLEILKSEAKANYATWNDPSGPFQLHYAGGLEKLKEQAILKGWNIDPNAIDANGKQIPISEQYIKSIREYNDEIYEDLIDKLTEDAEFGEIERLFLKLNPVLNAKKAKELETKVEQKHSEHNQGVINDTLIANNSNQNNGKFLDQANTIFALSSNNTTSNGIGGSVKDGFNSNDEAIDITGSQRNERIELLQQIVSTSNVYKKMIPQHQLTHVFAIQKLGVSKADSLYRKAEREYDLPEFKNTFPDNKAGRRQYAAAKKKFEEEFLKNPDNEKIIKAAILDKYNEFVLDATGDKYNRFYGATKTIFPNPPKRSDFATGATGGRAYSKAVKEFYQNPENATKVNPGVRTEDLDFFTGEKRFGGRTGAKDFAETKADKAEIYQNKVANDLEVLKKNVDYDYNPDTDETIIVDKVTGLQPKEKLVEKLKDTVIDEEELDYALKDLDIKYSKIENKTRAIYNQAFNNAKEIAFAEPGGWQNLIANNINIDNFTKQDQEILKNGQPVESDVDTEFELKSNPAEVATNLESHSHKLSNGQYLDLKRYADSLRSEDSVVEATGNVTMLKATLDRYDMGDLYTAKNKNKKRKYIQLNDAWLKEINARQIAKGNQKLTLGEKQEALDYILLTDLVNVDNFFRDEINVPIKLVDYDRLQDVYVDIPYKGENVRVFTSKIDDKVLGLIEESLARANKPNTQKNIADYFVRKGQPKNVNEAFAYREED
jgi:hypothetical protein